MKRSHAILMLGLLSVAVAVIIWKLPEGAPPAPVPPGPPPPTPAPDQIPIVQVLAPPPFAESPFLNTRADATHIGSSACAECHPGNHKSYLLTAHSRALGDVDPSAEPPDAAFEHKPSGRSYRVYRKGGQLWHQESLKTADGKEIARTDLPMRYRVGSGHFTRSYFVEVDGFLHESPITWYESKKQWDTSPGYDAPDHYGFERPAQAGCVVCHAGHFESVGGSDHRLKFHEQAIGCESCHGPGSLHQDLHRAKKHPPGQPDFTIVHPGKLSRPLLESICASCHLAATVSVDVRGRQLQDFRPGLPLSDFRVHYTTARKADQMKVVGHVEQLRQSACYQKSGDLSCVTCHDPHAKAKPADPVAFHRQKCLDCHQNKGCSLPVEDRIKQNPADNCAACHMPKGDTEIQHVAFTHHRIGRHAKPAPGQSKPDDGAPELVPVDENPRLALPDRQRNLGQAYHALFSHPRDERHDQVTAERARANLHTAYVGGAGDAATIYTMAELFALGRDLRTAARFAREALAAPSLRHDTRARSLAILASFERQNRNFPAAREFLTQATQLRRHVADWEQLGWCWLEENNPDKAIPAFQQALAIWPYRVDAHLGLAACYQRLGDTARATEHREKAAWLKRHLRQ
jgi:hypothetical protein